MLILQARFKRTLALVAAGTAILALVSQDVARAQVSGGTIQGTISDSSQAVVPDAKVSIMNVETGVVTVVASNETGAYSAPNLLPGPYDISASKPGFNNALAKNITLTVGAQRQINLTLTVGSETATIVVTGTTPQVDLSTSTLSAVVEGTTVRELPLNGRDWTQLATLETGVSAVRTQVALSSGPDRGNRGYGAQLTISGGRPAQNNYRLDGVSINDYSNGAPGSVLGANLGVDAVEEFSVLTSNYSAEYGRTSGGVINAITKSGTNEFHGSAYEFFRNSALDARNFFDGATKAPFRRNQFGASAGGPIIKDRTFLFGDYEGDRQSTSISQPITVFTPAARAMAVPAVQRYLGFFPLPSAATQPGDLTGNFTSTVKQITNENYFTIRGDHRISDKDSLAGTYVFDDAATTQPDVLAVVLTGNKTKRQIVTAEETRTFKPNFVNTIRFGFNQIAAFAGQNVSTINPLAADTTLGAVPGRPAPGIVFGDGAIVTFPGGLGASPNYRFHWSSYQLYDDAFVAKGKHLLKFGFATEYIQDNILASSDENGVVTFALFTDFLQNNAPQNFNAAIPSSITERQLRQHIFAGYLQDDFKLRPNLTLNAGLRYEMATVPTETSGRLSTLLNPTDATPHLGSPFFQNPTLWNFEPRVGFAWDPFGDSKTSVRGGFGMFDVLPLPYLYSLLVPLAAPFYQLGNSSNLPAAAFPGGLFSLIGASSNLRQSFVEQNPKRNYVMQWNVNVQREIVKNLTGLVAFVGSRSIHQAFRADDINTVLPIDPTSLTPTYPLNGQLLNPNVGQISSVIWNGDSYYKSMQASMKVRMTSKVQAQASYTLGSAVDTGSATVGGDSFANSISSLPFYNSRLRRGPADFDIRHNLVVSYHWFLPSPKFSVRPANWVLGGWELGGVYQLSSGVPFTPNIGGDPLGLGSTDPFDFPDRLTGPGCDSLVNPGNIDHYIKTECLAAPNPLNRRGNLRRNSVVGPRLQNFDFSLLKNSPAKWISDDFRVQLRMEFFNIFNHANFGPPINHQTVFDQNGLPVAGAGQLDSTSTFSRQIQFGLKLIW